MSENNTREATKYRKRESALRSSYRRKMTLLLIVGLIIGLVAGCIGGVQYQKNRKTAAPVAETATPAPVAETGAQDDEFLSMFGEDETAEDGDYSPFGASAEGNEEDIFSSGEDDGAELTEEDIFGDAAEDENLGEDFGEFPTEDEVENELDELGGEAEEAEAELEAEIEEIEAEAESAAEEAAQVEETGESEEAETVTEEENEELSGEDGDASVMGEDGVDLFNPGGTDDGEETEPAEEEPAAEEPAEEAVTEEPAAEEPVEEPAEEQIEAVYQNEDASFTAWITPEGAMYEGEGEYIEIPVTVRVIRHMGTDYYIEKYTNEYQLKGDEACVEMQIGIGAVDGVESVLAQNIMITQLEDEDGNVIAGYQFKDAEIGGATDSTIAPGEAMIVYKRYSSAIEKQPVYVTVEYWNEGMNKLYFSFEDAPERPEAVSYKLGDKGDGVKALQNALIKLGYLEGTADGDFGAMTEKALMKAQTAYGFEATGVADEAFLARLFADAEIEPTEAPASEPETTEEPVNGLKKGDTGDEVKKMQAALIKLGYLQGQPDGSFGAYTEDALKRAQNALGFERTGVADEAFLKALYEKAGME